MSDLSDPHPDAETLARYVRGALGRADSRALEQHLAGCLACQAAVEELPAPAGAVVHWAGHRFAGRPEPRLTAEEEARRARLQGTIAEIAGVLGTLGEGFAARLLAESEHGRRALIRSDRRFQAPAVCAALLARSREAWFEDPPAAVELAKLGVAVAGHLEGGGDHSEAWKALAWMHLGNAYRIASGGGAASGDGGAFGPAGIADVAEAPAREPAGEVPARWEEAESALKEVGESFLAQGLDVEAALVSYELAAACLRRRRPEEVEPLAREAAARLDQAGAGPAARQALTRLRQAAQSGALTLSWLADAAVALRRNRQDSGPGPSSPR